MFILSFQCLLADEQWSFEVSLCEIDLVHQESFEGVGFLVAGGEQGHPYLGQPHA